MGSAVLGVHLGSSANCTPIRCTHEQRDTLINCIDNMRFISTQLSTDEITHDQFDCASVGDYQYTLTCKGHHMESSATNTNIFCMAIFVCIVIILLLSFTTLRYKRKYDGLRQSSGQNNIRENANNRAAFLQQQEGEALEMAQDQKQQN